MDVGMEKDKKEIILAYYTECREIEIIEAKPHDNIDKYLISDKSIRLDIFQANKLYLFLKNVLRDSDS